MGKLLSTIGVLTVAALCVAIGWKSKEESLKPKKEKPADEETVDEEKKKEVVSEVPASEDEQKTD